VDDEMQIFTYSTGYVRFAERRQSNMLGLKDLKLNRLMGGVRRIRSGNLLLVFVFFFLFSQSCYKDYWPEQFPSEYEWNPFLAFPIGEVDFGLVIPYGFHDSLLRVDSLGNELWSRLDTIPMAGGIGFDFEEVLGNREEVDTAIFRVNAYNGFPIEIEIRGYTVDKNEQVLDTLFTPSMKLERGIMAGGGETSEYKLTQEDVHFGSERLDLLMDAKSIRFEGDMVSGPFFKSLTFKIQMGAVLGVVEEF